jgi:ATP-binding protein involved in chromosome partitioning
MVTEEQIMQALSQVQDPELGVDIVTLGMVKEVKIKGDEVTAIIALTVAGCPLHTQIQRDVENAIRGVSGVKDVRVVMTSMTDEERSGLAARMQGETNSSPLMRGETESQVIAVASGKGGVGKSTVTANLGLALARQGYRVGIIDADIYGFSIPRIFGIPETEKPRVVNGKIIPIERQGVRIVSMGFFVQENVPIIWRGPMLGKAIEQFLTDVDWGSLDYLLLDLPPGTGDVALDVHRLLARTKDIIVTTPEPTAVYVATRAGKMAEQTESTLLGVVENMSYYRCGHCQEKNFIFGHGGGERLAAELNVPLLAQIPLTPRGDDVNNDLYEPNTEAGQVFADLAQKIAAEIAPPPGA